MKPGSVRTTMSESVIYGGGQALQRSVGFLMLPIYTRYLSPADYGVLSLLTVAVETIAAFLSIQFVQALFRYFSEESSEQVRNRMVSTTLILSVLIKIFTMFIVVLLSDQLATVVLADNMFGTLVALFAVTIVTDMLVFVPLQYMRLLGRPKHYVGASLLKLIIQLSLNVWFLAVLGIGIKGVIFSNIISGAVIGGGLTFWVIRRTGFNLEFSMAKKLASYSWPLILSGIFTLYAHQIGPIALTHISGLAQVGLLALAMKFSSVVSLLVTDPFMQSWGVRQFAAVKDEDAIQIFRQMFLILSTACITVAVFVSVFAEIVIRKMAAPEFWGAAELVPFAALIAIVNAVSQFSKFGVLIGKKTHDIAISMGLMIFGITVCLFLTIRTLGAMGVLIGMLCGGCLALFWLIQRGKKNIRITLPWLKFWILLAMALVTYIISVELPFEANVGVPLRLLLVAVFVTAVYRSPVLGDAGRQELKDLWIQRKETV